jgi:pimeloyl-ACP methyl ester carboxylesterase
VAERLRAYRTALSVSADRASTVAASVQNMYTDQASSSLRTSTARQILDASPHIDVLFDEQARYDPRGWLRLVAGLETPIRYVHGTSDAAVPLHMPRELARLTGSQVVEIEGAGHLAE